MSDPAASPTADLKDTLEEMRASVAARGARKGLRGAIQEAIFSLLEVLLGLLADFRAGRLAPVGGGRGGWRGLYGRTPLGPAHRVNPRVKPEDGGKPARQGRERRSDHAGQAHASPRFHAPPAVENSQLHKARSFRGGGGMRAVFAALSSRPIRNARRRGGAIFKNWGLAGGKPHEPIVPT